MTQVQAPEGATVVEYFDQHSPEFVHKRYEWYEDIRRNQGPVFWSPRYGGYWIVLGHNEALKVLTDWKTFSSRAVFNEDGTNPEIDGIRYQGVFLDKAGYARPMLEADPPEASELRALLASLFTAEALEKKRPRVQEFANACIDRHIASGKIDFCSDLTIMIPALVTLEFIGAPLENWDWVADMHLKLAHVGIDQFATVAQNLSREREMLSNAIDAHEDDRGDNIISTLLDARDSGVEISRYTILELVTLLLAAGIDTTASVTGSTLVALTRQPELRDKLRDDPKGMATAFAEFVRFAAPTQGLCRTVTQDVDLGGQHLRRGDRVMISFAAACRDPEAFAGHAEINIGRKPNINVAFGGGVHRCIGSVLARVEFEVMIDTVLQRMPDFQVDLDHAAEFESCGLVAGYRTIPATFTPGRPLGVDPKIKGWEPVGPG